MTNPTCVLHNYVYLSVLVIINQNDMFVNDIISRMNCFSQVNYLQK